jgi:PhoD-like phosphatase
MTARPVISISASTGRVLHRAGLLVGWLGVVALAVGAAAGWIPQNPEGGTLSIVEGPLQIGLLVLTGVGLAVAIRWPGPGAAVVVLGGLGLSVLSALQHAPWVAVVVAAMGATSGVLLWLSWQRTESFLAVLVLATVTTVVLATAWVGGSQVYDHFYGPTHPTSSTLALDDPDVDWAWAGGVTADSARVVVQPDARHDRVGIVVTDPGGAVRRIEPVEVVDGVAAFDLEGLAASTRYSYRFLFVDGHTSAWEGTVRTFPPPGDQRPVVIAFSSCARTGSSGEVFDAIREVDADLYVVTGDLHYQNISTDDPAAFAVAYDRVLTAPAQAALYRATPVAYVWDDHDFGGNDADGSSASWPAARAMYERSVPSYELVDDRTINQAFSIGDVRVVLLDTRAAREPGATLLGERQLEWLLDEIIRSAGEHRVVIVASSTPWIAAPDPASDTWGGFAAERRRIADVIAEQGLDNVILVGGDAHMVAIDDGSNSDYSDAAGAPLPVLQAAALDRPGSVKGGPYSEGTFPGGGQFGTVTVTPSGDSTTVTLAGRDHTGAVLVSLDVVIGP